MQQLSEILHSGRQDVCLWLWVPSNVKQYGSKSAGTYRCLISPPSKHDYSNRNL